VATYAILRSLGKEVRERREQRNLTQEELADLAGFHTNVIGRLERGRYNTTVLTLAAIALTLNTSLADLFAGADRRA
jgi:transcriptional regulator with XRE-family HTH domain